MPTKQTKAKTERHSVRAEVKVSLSTCLTLFKIV